MKKALPIKKILTIIGIIAFAVLAIIYFSALMPILFAILAALIAEPFVRILMKWMKTEKRILPVTIVFLSFLLISTGILYFTIARVYRSFYEWSLQIPVYALELQRFIDGIIIEFNTLIEEFPQANVIISELENQTEGIFNTAVRLTSELVTMIGSWLQAVPNLLFVSLIFLITFFLISLDLPRLKRMFFQLFKPETSTKLQYISQKMGKVFLGYWKAQFILSVGVFIVTYIALYFIAPDLALFMSFAIWVVDIIPLYVGPALILVPWGILAMILGSMNQGIQLMVLALVLLVIRRIIEPKVLGDSIGLAALPTVLSMYFGFIFGGVMGLIAGPFVYIAIKSAIEAGLFNLVDKKIEEKEEEQKEKALMTEQPKSK
ncbi:sporulation integral membrane protein YtvI [Alkalihalobacillus pseudalcaliphilus]|uniref:sporulation integral membrane protein YtvI n=1 Tax=Alkalihalobacillus pseudalcaliphilus TaxID=79884 RepID=UPI00064DA4BD|nr:sporulation integral membrane protein YtvI [Alkalihalobacillus pseudalcaliphilus]KMK77928.1 sporulation integral membrane protein YtvI [Alkalihalobacillus pseudalcaliphilus]